MSPAPSRPTLPRASARFTIAATLSAPYACCVIPIDQTSTAALAARVHAREALHVVSRRARCRSRSSNDSCSSSSSSSSNPVGVLPHELAVDAALGEQHLQHAVEERDIAAGVHREELVGHLRAEHRALDVARHPVPLEAGLPHRVDDRDLRPALAGQVEVLHEHRLGVRDVRAEQDDQVAADHVGVRAVVAATPIVCLSAVVDGAWQTRAALSTLLRAEEPRHLLRDVVDLVRDAARGEVEREASGAAARMRPATRSSASSHEMRVKPLSPRRRTIGYGSRPRSRSSLPSSARSCSTSASAAGRARPSC